MTGCCWSTWGATASIFTEHNEENPIYSSQVENGSLQLQKFLDRKKHDIFFMRYSFSQTDLTRILIPDLVLPQEQHVRLSTIRLTNCSASFVSPAGLILTNHHCVESCLGELSSKDNSLLERGFLAPTRGAERRCATQIADVLVSTENITAEVAKAAAGMSDP